MLEFGAQPHLRNCRANFLSGALPGRRQVDGLLQPGRRLFLVLLRRVVGGDVTLGSRFRTVMLVVVHGLLEQGQGFGGLLRLVQSFNHFLDRVGREEGRCAEGRRDTDHGAKEWNGAVHVG